MATAMYMVVKKDDLNIVQEQRLFDDVRKAKVCFDYWTMECQDTDYNVEVHQLHVDARPAFGFRPVVLAGWELELLAKAEDKVRWDNVQD